MSKEDAEKAIQNAWIVGLVSGGVTLIITLTAIGGSGVLRFSSWTFLDIILTFGLAFGIYKKSWLAAVTMLIYFVFSQIMLRINVNSFRGIVIALIFIYFYVQGIRGTFAYHNIIKQEEGKDVQTWKFK